MNNIKIGDDDCWYVSGLDFATGNLVLYAPSYNAGLWDKTFSPKLYRKDNWDRIQEEDTETNIVHETLHIVLHKLFHTNYVTGSLDYLSREIKDMIVGKEL